MNLRTILLASILALTASSSSAFAQVYYGGYHEDRYAAPIVRHRVPWCVRHGTCRATVYGDPVAPVVVAPRYVAPRVVTPRIVVPLPVPRDYDEDSDYSGNPYE